MVVCAIRGLEQLSDIFKGVKVWVSGRTVSVSLKPTTTPPRDDPSGGPTHPLTPRNPHAYALDTVLSTLPPCDLC